MQPHDTLFKATFSQVEHAAGELRHALPPELTARLMLDTLALEPGSFVDESLKERHSDLLFSVSTVRAGKGVLLYLLFEHQSTVDRLMAFRLLRYMVRIWDKHLAEHPEAHKLPPIVPVVLHHSESGWTAATAFEDLLEVDEETLRTLGANVPRFRFLLDDISHETDDGIHARAMTALARLVLWCLRHAREPEELVLRLGRWMDLVREVRRAPDGGAALRRFWQYILATSQPRNPEDLVLRLRLAAGEEEKEEIVTAAEQLIERGERKALLRLLRQRFGALPEQVMARVNAAGTAQIELWLDRVLTAPTLVEVLGDAG